MNKRLLKKSRERKYTVSVPYLYIVISKQTGKFFKTLDYRKVSSWGSLSELKSFCLNHQINMDSFLIYRVSIIGKVPNIERIDRKNVPKIRSRNPLTQNEEYDFKLIDKLTAAPLTYDLHIDDNKIWFEKKNKKENQIEENYVFKESGNKLLNEIFHFLKINSDEIQRKEI